MTSHRLSPPSRTKALRVLVAPVATALMIVSVAVLGSAPAAASEHAEAAVQSSVAFPDSPVGQEHWRGSTQLVWLQNTGDGPLDVHNMEIVDAGNGDAQSFDVFSLCGLSWGIPPGASCQFGVFFRPATTGIKNATLLIHTNDPESPDSVALTGTGITASQIEVQGPGATFVEGHGNAQTLTIGTAPDARATYSVKVINTSAAPQSYRLRLATQWWGAETWLTSPSIFPRVSLTQDATGRWILPTMRPGASQVFTLQVDPHATHQVTSITDIRLETPDGPAHDYARTETNVQAPIPGTDGYGTYARAYGGAFVGGQFSGQTTTYAPFNPGDTRVATVKLRNDSTATRSMQVTMEPRSNRCWSTTVKRGLFDITAALLSEAGHGIELKPGAALDLTVTTKRLRGGCGSASWEFATWADGKRNWAYIRANAVAGTETIFRSSS